VAERQNRTVKFTIHKVKTLADGMWSDATQEGLYLLVRHDGKSRSYLHRFTFNGVPNGPSVGAVARTTLDDARKAVREAKVSLDKGINPYSKKAAPTDAAPTTVWDDCNAWFNHERRTWALGYQDSVKGWMEHDIQPLCGNLETRKLTPAVVAALFYRADDPDCVWLSKNETAQRIISILRRAINHAIANDDSERFKDWTNPILALKSRLPKGCRPDPVSRRAIHYRDAPRYYRRVELKAVNGETATQRSAAVALLTMIDTLAPRANEVLDMQWIEFDEDTAVWEVPAGRTGRTKNKRNDRVVRDIPLAKRTLARLLALKPVDARPTDYVFSGRALGGKRLGHQQMRLLMQRLVEELGIDATPHGWRTTAKSWVLDNAMHVNDAIAIEIAHDRVVETPAGDRYRDTTYREHRRILSERWLAFLLGERYIGDYAPRALSVVVDNAAVA
jgi:integrase